MTNFGTRLADAGFGRPRGLLGRMGGRLMARGNAATERHLVQLAALGPEETVLVIGPGPGVGLQAVSAQAGHVVGVDPSELMLASCRRRCDDLIKSGTLRLVLGDAQNTGQPDGCADAAISVNNVMLWANWAAGFAETWRVLRPGGRLLISVHQKWLPGGLNGLKAAVGQAGFAQIETWTWEPPGRGATTAAQLRARKPSE